MPTRRFRRPTSAFSGSTWATVTSRLPRVTCSSCAYARPEVPRHPRGGAVLDEGSRACEPRRPDQPEGRRGALLVLEGLAVPVPPARPGQEAPPSDRVRFVAAPAGRAASRCSGASSTRMAAAPSIRAVATGAARATPSTTCPTTSRQIFRDACALLALHSTDAGNTVYVSRKADVARMDIFVRPKT